METSYSHQEADPHRRVSWPEGGADVGKPKLLVLLETGMGGEELLEPSLFGKDLRNTEPVYLEQKTRIADQIIPLMLDSFSD